MADSRIALAVVFAIGMLTTSQAGPAAPLPIAAAVPSAQDLPRRIALECYTHQVCVHYSHITGRCLQWVLKKTCKTPHSPKKLPYMLPRVRIP
jgi:hypothetical protein